MAKNGKGGGGKIKGDMSGLGALFSRKNEKAAAKEIQKGCKVLGLTLHDHIIVGLGREVSLRTRGEL